METSVLLLVLGAAVIHAAWNALVKSGGQPWLRVGTVMATSGVMGWILVPFVPFPSSEVWPYILFSAFFHQCYFVGICLGYRHGDLSHVYPIQRGLAPFLIAIGAWWFAGDRLNTQGLAGVVVIGVAILSLAIASTKWPADAKAFGFAVFSGCAIAAYSVSSGIGGRASENVLSFIVWVIAISDLPFGIVAIALNFRRSGDNVRRHMALGVIGGVLTAVSFGIVIWAMTKTPITYVAAVRETSVVLAAWMGSRLFGEPFGRQRIAAAVLVVIGVALLQTS